MSGAPYPPVNCAQCRTVLLPRPDQAKLYKRATVAGRAGGRPYCEACLQEATPPALPGGLGEADRAYHGGLFNKGEW